MQVRNLQTVQYLDVDQVSVDGRRRWGSLFAFVQRMVVHSLVRNREEYLVINVDVLLFIIRRVQGRNLSINN